MLLVEIVLPLHSGCASDITCSAWGKAGAAHYGRAAPSFNTTSLSHSPPPCLLPCRLRCSLKYCLYGCVCLGGLVGGPTRKALRHAYKLPPQPAIGDENATGLVTPDCIVHTIPCTACFAHCQETNELRVSGATVGGAPACGAAGRPEGRDFCWPGLLLYARHCVLAAWFLRSLPPSPCLASYPSLCRRAT